MKVWSIRSPFCRHCRLVGIGALILLMLVGTDFSVIALIGVDPVDRHCEEERHHAGRFLALEAERNEGLSPEDSVYRACVLRFRPILMTTMAALLGGVPLMLGVGAGSELRQPLGYTIVGGLIFSQILTSTRRRPSSISISTGSRFLLSGRPHCGAGNAAARH